MATLFNRMGSLERRRDGNFIRRQLSKDASPPTVAIGVLQVDLSQPGGETNGVHPPHGVTRYVLDSIPPIGGAGRVQPLHRGGHMFYFDAAARRALEAAEFYGRGM